MATDVAIDTGRVKNKKVGFCKGVLFDSVRCSSTRIVCNLSPSFTCSDRVTTLYPLNILSRARVNGPVFKFVRDVLCLLSPSTYLVSCF